MAWIILSGKIFLTIFQKSYLDSISIWDGENWTRWYKDC